jgi:nucleoside-diphosphate-sugar epimerase
MTFHLHLLGGAGRIGTALVDSLVEQPLEGLNTIWIYCDSTKVVQIQRSYLVHDGLRIRARGYSAFSISHLSEYDLANQYDRHVVINLRGINNKVSWLNQPLDSFDLQIQACRCITNADLWMHRGVEIIHLSSQLCDLIESPLSLQEICEGQESYRRPYMVSRLHQEAILSAHAFQHAIPTSLLRLPAVYGFSDDRESPWVLNSLCKQYQKEKRVEPRNPDRLVYLLHRQYLVQYIRMLLDKSQDATSSLTVRFLRPPMLQMSVGTLASMVQEHDSGNGNSNVRQERVALISDPGLHAGDTSAHLKLLDSTIQTLLCHD